MRMPWYTLESLVQPEMQVGGLCFAYAIPLVQIRTFPKVEADTGYLNDWFLFHDDASWVKIPGRERSKLFLEETRVSEAGLYVEDRLTFFLPEEDRRNRRIVSQLLFQDLIVVLKERDGKMKLMGNAHHGLRLRFSPTSGDLEEVRGYQINLSGHFFEKAKEFSPEFEGTFDPEADLFFLSDDYLQHMLTDDDNLHYFTVK